MALNHDFLLLPDEGDRYSQVRRHINDPKAVSLHDDVIDYFWDTLLWIPTEIPGSRRKKKSGWGLNRWGPTAISGAGGEVGASVFRAWASLLANGPPVLELTGSWVSIVGEPHEDGHYHQHRIDRDGLISKCRAIAKMADRASSASGFWLLHLGV